MQWNQKVAAALALALLIVILPSSVTGTAVTGAVRLFPKQALSLAIHSGILSDEDKLQAASTISGIPPDRVKITAWKPDTCDCEVWYAWDKSIPQETRAHIPITGKAADYYSQFGATETLYVHVLADNQAKNEAVALEAKARGIKPESVEWAYAPDHSLIVAGHPIRSTN